MLNVFEGRSISTKIFFDKDKNTFGKLWAASGFSRRTRANSKLDWALIEFTRPSRLGTNTVPPPERWPKPELALSTLAGKTLRGVGSCDLDVDRKRVFKMGARTGLTYGKFNRLSHDVSWLVDGESERRKSVEFLFVSKGEQPFSLPGDSGALVFSRDRKFVGLVWGGPRNEQIVNSYPTFVTDAQALLKDMNDQLSGRYVLELAEED